MSILGQLDFSRGDLPPWLAPLISLTRPLATTMTGMLIPAGAFCCGLAALFSLEAGMNMAAASTAFLEGIPGELYMLVGGVFGVYSASKTFEAVKAPAPAGGANPEMPIPAPAEPAASAVPIAIFPPPTAEVDAAPRGSS